MHGYGHGHFLGHGFMWIIGMLIVVCVIYALVRKDQHYIPLVNDTSFEILKRRYAEGEISKEEYEEMKDLLGV